MNTFLLGVWDTDGNCVAKFDEVLAESPDQAINYSIANNNVPGINAVQLTGTLENGMEYDFT